MEKMFERCFYSARWLIAPVFLGLSLALVALALKFFQEVVHVLPHVFELSESDLILSLLSMIDMGLVGGLIVMVMYSSYENFVSRLDIEKEGSDKLSWLGKMDSGSLKNKVAASMVAISSIHLLGIFMNIEAIANDKLVWYVVIHLTFVLSAFVMCCIDILTKKTHLGFGAVGRIGSFSSEPEAAVKVFTAAFVVSGSGVRMPSSCFRLPPSKG